MLRVQGYFCAQQSSEIRTKDAFVWYEYLALFNARGTGMLLCPTCYNAKGNDTFVRSMLQYNGKRMLLCLARYNAKFTGMLCVQCVALLRVRGEIKNKGDSFNKKTTIRDSKVFIS
jgi:hypothetical protein